MNNTAAILLACLGICFIAYSSWAYYQRRCEARRQALLREEDAQRRYEHARSAVSPALVQAKGTAEASFDVTLDEEQVKLLRDTIVIGDDADDLAPIRMVVGDGHSGHGLYLAQAEYQDEGAVLLAAMPKPPAPTSTTVASQCQHINVAFGQALTASPAPAVTRPAPEGWMLVPKVGTRVKADHPITCLNPEETFEVTGIGIDNGRISVRGNNTCWFGLDLISQPPVQPMGDA